MCYFVNIFTRVTTNLELEVGPNKGPYGLGFFMAVIFLVLLGSREKITNPNLIFHVKCVKLTGIPSLRKYFDLCSPAF